MSILEDSIFVYIKIFLKSKVVVGPKSVNNGPVEQQLALVVLVCKQGETITDGRNKGWGKVSTILGILSEFQMGVHKLEAGLLLRQVILVSELLYSAETWSGVSEKQISMT